MKSFKQLSFAAALFAALAGSAIAAPVTYNVDGSHTYPRFSYSHFGYSTQLSSFKNTNGKVVFDAEAKTGSVDITIDMKSVNTGFDDFNGHIQGEDFLDTAKFPTATLTTRCLSRCWKKAVAGARRWNASSPICCAATPRACVFRWPTPSRT